MAEESSDAKSKDDAPAVETAGAAAAPGGRGRLPAWVKVLAAFSAFMIVFGAVSGVTFISWFRELMLNSLNPEYIAGTIKKIADFPPEATANLRPVMALRLPRLGGVWQHFFGVEFGEGPGKMQFDLVSYQSEDNDPDPSDVMDFCYEWLVPLPTITAKCESIVEKGKASINGHDFTYQVIMMRSLKAMKDPRDPEGHEGELYKGLIGCMTIGRKVIVVEAAVPKDQALDVNAICDFLRKAKSF